ncbi:MAG: ribose 5-phosphate isomerase B [Desulfobacterales bacterium]|nr:ribose 5-phosphate isomerase B [Desulfobacterales bacterium]
MTDQQAPVIIGCDHAAFELKEKIKSLLIDRGIPVEDVGTTGGASVDYPDYGKQVASQVSAGRFPRGILLCGTGLGMSMVANRFPGVRAALCHDLFGAMMARRHNDANILVLGGRVTGDILAAEIVAAWLETPFEGGRHQKRLDQFNQGI